MHFSVAVLSKTIDGYKSLLKAFHEDTKVKFQPMDKECYDEYEDGLVGVYVLPDGTLELRSRAEKRDPYASLWYEYKKVPFTELYPTFDDYVKGYTSYCKNEAGEYGYWYNPDARISGYGLGGQWAETLLVKENVSATIGRFDYPADYFRVRRNTPKGYKWVDAAQVKDVEWQLMEEVSDKEARELWNEFQERLKGEKEVKKIWMSIQYRAREDDTEESFVKRHTAHSIDVILTEERGWQIVERCELSITDFFSGVDPDLYLAIVDCHEN